MKRLLLVGAVLVLLGAAALWLGGERLLHPARHQVTGEGTLPPDRYAAVVARTAPATPLAALRFPAGKGAVIAEAERATVWLDPPTALVLDQAAREPDAAAATPLAAPALGPAAVLARARGVVGPGPELAEMTWPTQRRPDWQVRFRGGAAVDVADDSGVAARARVDEPIAAPVAVGWGGALLAGGAVLVVTLGLLAWVWRRR